MAWTLSNGDSHLSYYSTADGAQYSTGDGKTLAFLSLNLITDRTDADVTRWRELHDKGWAAMTEEERAEWSGAMKGSYGAADMNRIESAVTLLSERFRALGYLYFPDVKTNWTAQDVPTWANWERYFGNVSELRRRIPVFPSTPPAPKMGDRLNYSIANDLEKILLDINRIHTNITQSWYNAGEIYSGEA